MRPQDDSQRRRGIIEAIQKLDTEISSFNQQRQQLLRELKSIPISKPSIATLEAFPINEKTVTVQL
jgi:prefoldin subunit 5